MRWSRLRQLKVSHALLLLLLPAFVTISAIELRVRALDVRQAANRAFDRSLLGALRSIDASVSTEAGGLSVELPYRMFEFFELTASGPVHYRVATADGLVELGSADLPPAPGPLRTGQPVFYDGVYFGERVRLAAYLRDLEEPAEGSAARQLTIQVAESTRARDAFTREFVRRALVEQAIFLLVSAGLAVAVVAVALRPLAHLSRQIGARTPDDLSPIPDHPLPAEVRPVVAAMNGHMERIRELAARQRAFLDDASHQLRTHLTTLGMQADVAARGADGAREAVAALKEELAAATRSTNQLLGLARSDTATLQAARFETGALLEGIAREFLPQARARGVDLGVETEDHAAFGDAGLLHEAVSNLVANAIAYAPGARVTLRSAGDALGWSLTVEDDGPGLPADIAHSAGGRFVRGTGGRATGSGLGLAIAKSVAARHGGALRLEPADGGRGLRAAIWWPRATKGGE